MVDYNNKIELNLSYEWMGYMIEVTKEKWRKLTSQVDNLMTEYVDDDDNNRSSLCDMDNHI